jgi:probable O-glycosylation ligase (exosortase A-associated)
MSPHRMTYGFMYDAPVAMLTGGATLLGLLVSKDPKRLPLAPPLVWLAMFALWICIAYPFSLVQTSYNFDQLDKVLKIYLFTFVAVAVIWTRRQVDVLIAVACFSIAFFGIKGGIFTIATGGAYRVRGDGGFIAGNNEIALALIMITPLLYYFIFISPRRWMKWALWATFALCVIAAIGTQSRGGLLGVIGMIAMFIARSPHKLRIALPILGLAAFIPFFMPESWWDRMATIDNYRQDASAMGRINAWILAWNVATNHFFGGGFYLETQELFDKYSPNHDFIAVAHSIYFQVLGQQGFVGLFLYLGFWFSAWRTCRWVARHAPSAADQVLARMIEVSFAGFAVGGAFLNLAYFDGPYYLMAATVVLRYKVLAQAPSVPRPMASDRTPPQPTTRTRAR